MAQYINSNKPFVFNLNFAPADCTDIEITFKQGETELVKAFADITQNITDTVESDGRWYMPFAFTIEESNMFDADDSIDIQFKIVIAGIQDYTNRCQIKLTDIL